MLYKTFFTLVALLSSGVIPPPSPPRTVRQSRGPGWTNGLNKLAVADADLRSQQELRQKYRRVAVVALSDSVEAPVTAGDVAADVIQTGVRYGNQLILVDGLTSKRLFGSAAGTAGLQRIAKENDIDLVVLVGIDADHSSLTLELISASGETTGKISPVKLNDLTDGVIEPSVQSRATILEAINAVPKVHADQLGRQPMADFAGLQELVTAKHLLAAVTKDQKAPARAAIFLSASKAAQRAIASSPKLLEAYIVLASCQDELVEKEEVVRVLRLGRRNLSRDQHDLLTQLELRADYERFVKTSPGKSLVAYQELLETNPTNLTGLWAMIDILLSGDPPSPASGQDIQSATNYAAKLIAFHPQSGVSRMITEKGE